MMHIDPEDEDYKEGYVTLMFWKPADDEDTMVFIENNIFYEAIEKICREHITKKPKYEKELFEYLVKISNALVA